MTRKQPWLSVLVVLALWAGACAQNSGPTGRLADITREAAKVAAPDAVLTDVEFESFLSNAGLEKAFGARSTEILDLLHRGRAAVAAKRMPLNPSSIPSRGAAHMVGLPDVFMPLLFAETLAMVLDPMTASSGPGGDIRPKPLTSTDEGPTTVVKTSLNETDNVSASGSRVQLTMHWTYRMTTTDKKTGATLIDVTDDKTMVGTLDVCPSAAGIAPATLDVHAQSVAIKEGVTTTRTSTSNNTFSGHVDDQAVLRQVTQELNDQASWQSTSGGNGGFEFKASNFNWPANESGMGGGFDASSVNGSLSSSGDAATGDVNKSAGWMAVLDARAVQPGFKEAQRLWRNGRCVVVVVPDYSAETSVKVAEQEKVQHDEEVDVDSETKFGLSLRHRFSGALNQPVAATLSGEKKLEPTKVTSVPSSLTYTAPAEQDKQATVTLKSTSKRGIGTLVIAFHTQGKHLKLNATGRLTMNVSSLVMRWNFTIGPADFRKATTTTWEAAAAYKGTGTYLNFPLPAACKIAFTDKGSLYLVATLEKRADKSVWVVRLDQIKSTSTVAGTVCGYSGPPQSVPTGGFGVQLLQAAGDIVIPIDGGTVAVHGSHSGPTGPQTADITVKATVTQD